MIAFPIALAMISLAACGDDEHHIGDGQIPADHEQMDEHMHDQEDAPLHDDSNAKFDDPDEHLHV